MKSAKPRTRAIRDPTDWSRSEVSGVSEARMGNSTFSSQKGNARVTSIRSSLFKRAAESATSQNNAASGAASNNEERVFQDESEATDLDRSLTYLSNTSLEMCEYGKPKKKHWVIDIMALVHNGIRCELKDLGILLRAFKNIRHNLTVGDYNELRTWWTTFSGIVVDYLVLEEKVLMPWATVAVNATKSADPRATSFLSAADGRRQGIRQMVVEVSKTFGLMCDPVPQAIRDKNPPRRTLASTLILHLDQIIGVVADYMWEEEMQLPPLLSEYYKNEKKEREKIIQGIVQHASSAITQRRDEFFVLQTRWMTEPKLLKQHLKLLNSLADCNFSKITAQFELVHGGVIAVFKVRGNVE